MTTCDRIFMNGGSHCCLVSTDLLNKTGIGVWPDSLLECESLAPGTTSAVTHTLTPVHTCFLIVGVSWICAMTSSSETENERGGLIDREGFSIAYHLVLDGRSPPVWPSSSGPIPMTNPPYQPALPAHSQSLMMMLLHKSKTHLLMSTEYYNYYVHIILVGYTT